MHNILQINLLSPVLILNTRVIVLSNLGAGHNKNNAQT